MASHEYIDRDGNKFILYSDSDGNVTHYEMVGEGKRVWSANKKQPWERGYKGDKNEPGKNMGNMPSSSPNTERHWGLPVDSLGIQWMDNAAKLSIYGFALMGGTHIASKTPLGGLALIGFIGGTFCLVTSCVMYVLCPIPLVASFIADRM